MKSLFLLFITCFLCGTTFSQSFYATTGSDLSIKKITISGNTVTNEPVTGCPSGPLSIALHNNVIYYTNDVGSLFKADLANTTITNCTSIRAGVSFKGNNLTVDKNGLIYFVNSGGVLYQYDPVKDLLINKGIVPYRPAGDMIFYKDELYLAADQAGIIKININNPAASIPVISTPLDILGLAVVSISSTQNKVYGILNTGQTTAAPVEIDLDNRVLGQTLSTLPFFCWDAAGVVEDGSFLALSIDDIKSVADCPFTGKGTISVISNNATSEYKYTLTNTVNNMSVTNGTGIFPGTDPGNYTITLANRTESLPPKFYRVTQFQFLKPAVTITSQKPTCLDKGEITITTDNVNGTFNIERNGTFYGSSYTFTNLSAGPFTFNIRNATGCLVDSPNFPLDQATCKINIADPVVTEECAIPNKGHVVISAAPGTDIYTYTITSIANNTTSAPNSTGIFNNLDAGPYLLNVTSAGNGSDHYSITVPDYSFSNPGFVFDKTDASCTVSGSLNFTLAANSDKYTIEYKGASYPFDHVFTFPDDGSYSFKLLKPNGCVLANVTVPIAKLDCEVVFFPNTFSPNGDGVNDIFRPSQKVTADNFKFKIYNRLGALVFTSTNSQNGWDGQYGGKQAPAGVYYWMATYINNERLSKSQNGFITLVR